MWERLKAYEDMGLEPAMLVNYKPFEDEAISKGVTFYCPNCGAKMDGGDNDAAD